VTAMNTNSTATTAIWELAGLINNTSGSTSEATTTPITLSLNDVVQKCVKMQFTQPFTPADWGIKSTHLSQKFTYTSNISRADCEKWTLQNGEYTEYPGGLVYTVNNFSLQPTKDSDGYWSNATQSQWSSIYRLIADLIKNPPSTLERKIATESIWAQWKKGDSYADLFLSIPIQFEKGLYERGISIHILYNFTRPESTVVDISDTTWYDYATLGKQKTYIPSWVQSTILKPFVRWEGVVYAFWTKPQYQFKSVPGTWQNQPFNFQIPDVTYPDVGWPWFVFEVESNPQLLKDGLQILNGKTYMGAHCVNAWNCWAGMPEGKDTIVLYPTQWQELQWGFYTLDKKGYIYIDAFAPEKNLDLVGAATQQWGKTEVRTGTSGIWGILSRPTTVKIGLSPYGKTRNPDTGALIITKTVDVIAQEIADSLKNSAN
jgi:hypothetical protein